MQANISKVDPDGRLDRPSRYSDPGFVGWFVVRQFGAFAELRRAEPMTPASRFFERLPYVVGGGEVFYQTVTSLIRPFVKASSVCVDVGCGAGRMVGELARLGARTVRGIDASALMVQIASAIIGGDGTLDIELSGPGKLVASVPGWGVRHAEFVQGTAEALPMADNAVDVLTCTNVLHRLATPRQALREMARVLRPGGVALISNSYDWSEEYTPRSLWFLDVVEQLGDDRWQVVDEVDGVPYAAPVTLRKTTVASNHVVIVQKKS